MALSRQKMGQALKKVGYYKAVLPLSTEMEIYAGIERVLRMQIFFDTICRKICPVRLYISIYI